MTENPTTDETLDSLARAGVEPARIEAMRTARDLRELAGQINLPYLVKLTATGDEAEAEDLPSILVAARTLVDDVPLRDRRELRDSLYVLRDGQYDGRATTMARKGQEANDGR